MRKIAAVMFMTAVVILLLTSTLLAGNVERGTDGSLRANDVSYSPVDITVSKEALFHEMEWKKAVETPGVVVPLATTERSQMVDFFHQKIITVAKTGIVFDKKSKAVEIVNGREVESEVVFNPSSILWGVSLVAMLMSNILFKKRDDPFDINITFAAATFAAFAIFAATFAVAFAVAFAFFAFAFFAADSSKKVYVILVITYYVLMGVGALVMVASM